MFDQLADLGWRLNIAAGTRGPSHFLIEKHDATDMVLADVADDQIAVLRA
jgi:hypothetical protein